MFKTAIKQRPFLFCCVLISFLCAIIQVSIAHAAPQQTPTSQIVAEASPTPTATATATATPTPTPTTPAYAPTVDLSQPGQTRLVGHPGTKVTISLGNFAPKSTVNLHTTTAPNQCAPNGAGLVPFTGSERVTTDANGNIDLNNIPWPSNANQPTTGYYLCATSTTPALHAVSAQSFTVAQDVTVTSSSPTVQPGSQITITGENWVPAQQLTVAIAANRASGQSNVLVQGTVSSDSAGKFSIDLTIPENVPAGKYAISVVANNEPTLQFQRDNMLSIGAVTPTASPTVAATPTPSNSDGKTNSDSGLTFVALILGTLGVLLIITGAIMFAASPPTAPAR